MVKSKSVVGIKPGDFGVVIGYQIDEFNHTWSVECFIAFTLVFMGSVSTLTHLGLEPGCEDYSFLDQAVKHFEHGLDSILMHSHQNTKTGCILWLSWYYAFFSLFRVSMLD